jgi:hypothetical protein
MLEWVLGVLVVALTLRDVFDTRRGGGCGRGSTAALVAFTCIDASSAAAGLRGGPAMS